MDTITYKENYLMSLSNDNDNKYQELFCFSRRFVTNNLPSITYIYHPVIHITGHFISFLSTIAKLNNIRVVVSDNVYNPADICILHSFTNISELSNLISTANIKTKYVILGYHPIDVIPGIVNVINIPINNNIINLYDKEVFHNFVKIIMEKN